jgi:hypothetical protein
MALPKPLYDVYRRICQCELVLNKTLTDLTLREFQNLINEAQPLLPTPTRTDPTASPTPTTATPSTPATTVEQSKHAVINDAQLLAMYELVKGMYYSNKVAFMRYIFPYENKVNALVLWTESKQIAKWFNLIVLVYIKWDSLLNCYIVERHRTRERPNTRQPYNRGMKSTNERQTTQTDQSPNQLNDTDNKSNKRNTEHRPAFRRNTRRTATYAEAVQTDLPINEQVSEVNATNDNEHVDWGDAQ